MTFDTEPRSLDAWATRFREHVLDGPYHLFVVEVDGRVRGYAETGPLRPKAGYRPSVEVSVYLGQDAIGRGLGDALYEVLVPTLKAEEFHRAYAGIALPNDASIRLHERFGFHHLGTFNEVGFKLGRWVDVAWYERHI